MSEQLGFSLTQENEEMVNKFLLRHAEQRLSHAAPADVLEGLSKADKINAKRFKEAIDAGNLEPRSYLGNKFRSEIKGTPQGKTYDLLSRPEAAL